MQTGDIRGVLNVFCRLSSFTLATTTVLSTAWQTNCLATRHKHTVHDTRNMTRQTHRLSHKWPEV